MGNYVCKWYYEGIEAPPPPCLKNKTFYYYFRYVACFTIVNIITLYLSYLDRYSGNKGCHYIGLMGTNWGARNRSPIFFIALILSVTGLIMFCEAVTCLTENRIALRSMPFFYGTMKIVENGVTSYLNYNAGISTIAFNSCEGGVTCPPRVMQWTDEACDKYFMNCLICEDAPAKVSFPIVMAITGQIGQILTDLTRSTEKHDVHCQKFVGLVAGVIGIVGNLSALSDFANGCMSELSPNPNITVSMTKHAGGAFVVFTVATIMRFYDMWAHIIVPVPPMVQMQLELDMIAQGSMKELTKPVPAVPVRAGSDIQVVPYEDVESARNSPELKKDTLNL